MMSKNIVLLCTLLLATSIRADICPSESDSEDVGTRLKDIYRPPYYVEKNTRKLTGKSSSSSAHFVKLREKYKQLVARIRSLEQPGTRLRRLIYNITKRAQSCVYACTFFGFIYEFEYSKAPRSDNTYVG